MGKLIFENGDEVAVEPGQDFIAICEEQGVPFACTEGICGTCVIEVVEGMEHLSPKNEQEKDFLGESGCERLACQCKMASKGLVKLKI